MKKTKRSAREYVESEQHLPAPLRDFHDAKNFFKWMEATAVEPTRAERPDRNLPDWTTAHIFTIDYFLWFMGQFGYTLQRSRANVEFRNLGEELQAHRQREIEHFRKLMEQGKI